MNALRFWATTLVTIWVANVLNQGVAPHLQVFGVRPDFLFIAAACLSLMARPGVGAVVGALSGFAHAAIVGANLTHYVTSRSIAGFGISLARNTDFTLGPTFAAVSTFLGTLLADFVFLFFAPPPDIASFTQATIGTAIYNGVFAVPLFAVLRRLAMPDKVDL